MGGPRDEGRHRLSTPERQLALLVESVADYAIFMLDETGCVATWNRGAERIGGYRADEVLGSHFSRFYTEADRDSGHPDHELRIAAEIGRYQEEGWRVRKDGGQIWANVVLTAIRDEDGALIGFGQVIRDLSVSKSLRGAQEQLARSHEELAHHAAAAAHDLATPLAAIAGIAELLEPRVRELGDEASNLLLENLVASARDAMNLVRHLGSYAIGGGEAWTQLANAREAAVDAIRNLAPQISESNASVELATPEDAIVVADHLSLERVLQNLISNAIKHGRAGAHVHIAAHRVPGHWRIEVVDDGPGIDPDQRELVFTPFERGDSGPGTAGSGLGLAICRKIVERHHGQIGVESAQAGTGTRLWFTLPAPQLPRG